MRFGLELATMLLEKFMRRFSNGVKRNNSNDG